jgi:L-amino acid N-acyltransferase YncA|tara:strand:- start:489 stop:926 length:438 start_codon:yes stop_codon:yes gene_type:complete
MIIRRATLLDVSAIIFLLQMMHKETEIETPKINTAKMLDRINMLLHKGVVLVAEKDKLIVGTIAGQVSQDWWTDEQHLADTWYYVRKDYRKSIIGKKLLQDFIKIAKEAKVKLRLGHIFSGDIKRKDKFYERMGFVKAGSVYMEA